MQVFCSLDIDSGRCGLGLQVTPVHAVEGNYILTSWCFMIQLLWFNCGVVWGTVKEPQHEDC